MSNNVLKMGHKDTVWLSFDYEPMITPERDHPWNFALGSEKLGLELGIWQSHEDLKLLRDEIDRQLKEHPKANMTCHHCGEAPEIVRHPKSGLKMLKHECKDESV